MSSDLGRLREAKDQADMKRFPEQFPGLFKAYGHTWGDMLDARVKDPKLKAILSTLWGCFGLPPSKLAAVCYAMPVSGYLSSGGYYPIGRSQKISDQMVSFFEERGGKVLLRTRVEKILVKDRSAGGVRTAGGDEYRAKVVVSNASAHDTFCKMLGGGDYLRDYPGTLDGFNVSLSCFQVFLGLKKDLVREAGIEDSEVFLETGYDPDAGYQRCLAADVENCGMGVMFYDNLYRGAIYGWDQTPDNSEPRRAAPASAR